MRRILTLDRFALVGVVTLAVVASACGSETDDGDAAAAPTTVADAPETAEETADETAGDASTATTVAEAPESTSAPATTGPAPATTAAPPADLPTIVVTTNILGDVVSAVVGDLAEVEVIMPLGADPHDFAPSAKQAAAMEEADLLVINGLNFEEGMLGVIESVLDGGTPVFAFAEAIQPIEGGHSHDHGGEDTHDHGGEDTHDHGGEDTHDHEGELPDIEGPGLDPHFWTDPARMAVAADSFVDTAVLVGSFDETVLRAQAADYVAELEALDAEIEAALAAVPAEDRVLVTNHEVFGYFADRYGFEVVGAVVPSLTTAAETSVRELEELAATIEAEGITAIFAETTQSTELAEALAGEVGGDVAVVELFTESLGEPGSGAETYIDLMRTNAQLIVAALTGA